MVDKPKSVHFIFLTDILYFHAIYSVKHLLFQNYEDWNILSMSQFFSLNIFQIGGIGHGPLQDTLSVGARTAIRTKLEFTLRQLTKMLNKLDVEV